MAAPANTRNFVVKNQTVLLRAISDVTQAKVGEAMGGKYASYVSQFLAGEQKISLDELLAMLEVCNLALHRVSEADLIVPRDEWRCMVRIAQRYYAILDIE